jgi:hexosaminidase
MRIKSTLDPHDPRSLALVQRMTEDLLPHFTSGTFNMNLDEPFELGKGKNEARAKREGVGAIYAEYVGRMHALAQAHHKSMQMWADVASLNPAVLDSIPKDITLLEWGYEAAHPFRAHGERIRQSGHPFMVCPGTSTWMSFSGRTENMLANVENAAQSGLATGASGFLMTDWGDLGHWQYWPASFAGMAYGAALAWNTATSAHVPLEAYLNEACFHDAKGLAARSFLELGRYNRFEETLVPNATSTFLGYQIGYMDRVLEHRVLVAMGNSMAGVLSFGDEALRLDIRQRFDHLGCYRAKALEAWLDSLESQSRSWDLQGEDAELIRGEYANTIRFIRLGARFKNYVLQRAELPRVERVSRLRAMQTLASEVEREHRRLWLARNRPGGLDRSLSQVLKVQGDLSAQIVREEKPFLVRGVQRCIEKLGAGAGDLLLRAD